MKQTKKKPNKNSNNSVFSGLRPKNWSLAAQMIVVIAGLFSIFYAFQYLITNSLFSNYFILKEKEYYSTMVEEINRKVVRDKNYTEFDASYDLFNDHSIYAIVTDTNFNVLNTTTEYTISLAGFTYSIPDTTYNFQLDQEVVVYYDRDLDNHFLVRSIEIYSNNSLEKTIYYDHEDKGDYHSARSKITEIVKPSNFNNILNSSRNNKIIQEVKGQYNSDEKFQSFLLNDLETNNFLTHLVYTYNLGNGHILINIISISGADSIVSTVQIYNMIIFAVLMVLIVAFSSLICSWMVAPIKEITTVTQQIANLNFDERATQKGNKETVELAYSINELADSLTYHLQMLQEQNKEIQEFYEEQENQFLLKKQLVASMSHELKTPLFVIQATINGIQDGIFTKSETKKELENINKEIKKSTKIIEDILNVYKLDLNPDKLQLEETDLVSFHKDILVNFVQNCKNKNITMHIYKNKEELMVNLDQKQFSKVFKNLIVNAIKYTPNNQKIEIYLMDSEEAITYTITNYGITIPARDLPHVFEAFYRVDKTGYKSDAEGGTGLGLYTVMEIVKAHGFTITAKNLENATQFEITFPKRKVEIE